jgi:hypothetical protein
MQKNTKLGAALLAAGAGAALVAAEASEHGAMTVAVATGILTGAFTALGTTTLVVAWATRPPAAGDGEA